jgi:hypothetical protein
MASKSAIQKFVKNSYIVQRGAEKARQDIFGHVPQLNLPGTGHKNAKKIFTGPYLAQYYPTSINEYARKVSAGVGSEMSWPGLFQGRFGHRSLTIGMFIQHFRSMRAGRQSKRSTDA